MATWGGSVLFLFVEGHNYVIYKSSLLWYNMVMVCCSYLKDEVLEKRLMSTVV
jgi:hypothetical protein